MSALALALLLVTAAPAPEESGDPTVVPSALLEARRLGEELRFEEAVVEYQRYLGLPDRPASERARALFELGFVHHVLGDELSAEQRAFAALELEPSLRLPKEAPTRQARFLETVRERFEARTTLRLRAPERGDAPEQISVELRDPRGRVHSVLLRHALSPKGPFYAQALPCDGPVCSGEILAPRGVQSFTAWYYVEAVDREGNTLARASGPTAPQQVSIVQRAAWYQSPWVYAGGGAVLVGAATVFYLLAAPPR